MKKTNLERINKLAFEIISLDVQIKDMEQEVLDISLSEKSKALKLNWLKSHRDAFRRKIKMIETLSRID